MQQFGVVLSVVSLLIGFASAQTILPNNTNSSVPVTPAITTLATGVNGNGAESQTTTTRSTNSEQTMVQNDEAHLAETSTPMPTRPSVVETTKPPLVHSPKPVTTTPAPEEKNKKDGKSGASKSSTAGYFLLGFTTILMISFV